MTALPLAPILDTGAAAALRSRLLATITNGTPVLVDAEQVERIGLACLQVLASTRIGAAAAGLDFAVLTPSPAFAAMVELAGLDLPTGNAR